MHSLKTARRGAQLFRADQATSLPRSPGAVGHPDLNGPQVFFSCRTKGNLLRGGMSRRDGRGDQANEGGGHPAGFSHGSAGEPRFAPQQHQHPSRTPASVYGSGYSGAGDYAGAQVPGQQHGGTRPGYPQHGQSVHGGAGMPRQSNQPVSASPTLSAKHAPCAQFQLQFHLVCRTLPLAQQPDVLLPCVGVWMRAWMAGRGCGCLVHRSTGTFKASARPLVRTPRCCGKTRKSGSTRFVRPRPTSKRSCTTCRSTSSLWRRGTRAVLPCHRRRRNSGSKSSCTWTSKNKEAQASSSSATHNRPRKAFTHRMPATQRQACMCKALRGTQARRCSSNTCNMAATHP